MAENLFPAGYEAETLQSDNIVQQRPIGYRNGIAYDDEIGDFKRDGGHKLLDSTGIESWKSWCINCISTERYRHLAYSSDFGIELEPVFHSQSRQEAESILSRQITEAILADPYQRADYIADIQFQWIRPDAVQVQATIHGIENVSIDVTAYITRGNG